MALFGMITTERSRDYTPLALRSFFEHTPAADIDAFVLIDNDGTFQLPPGFEQGPIALVKRPTPASFSANANECLARARERGVDLVLMNNDLVFTAGWYSPLLGGRPAIVSPLSNAQVELHVRGVMFGKTLDLEEFAGHERDLADAAAYQRASGRGFHTVASVPFFCVRIPHAVLASVGDFDESFGPGGGEDRDFAIRAWLAGFPCQWALGSFVLHFQGRSTWRSGETDAETAARNNRYTRTFVRKWGEALTYAFLHEDWNLFLGDPDLRLPIKRRQFTAVIEALQARPALAPFLERQRRARFGAVICANEGDAGLGASVASIYPPCSEILVLVGRRLADHPTTGRPSPVDPGLQLDDPDRKVRIVPGVWRDEASQWNDGLRMLEKSGIDYCLVASEDQVFNPVFSPARWRSRGSSRTSTAGRRGNPPP